MARTLWRATVVTHRYLGVAVGLLMVVWFISGIVMMYVPYPQLSNAERLRVAEPISWRACCTLSEQRYAEDQPVRSAQLEMVAGEPVLSLRPEGQPERMSGLGPSGPSFEIDAAKARMIALAAAARILGGPAERFSEDVIDRDQWTVGEAGQGNRPLFRYVFDDPKRTILYVSSTTGEVVLWTTATQRFWNWLGAVPHWLYFTELRANGPLWSEIVIWSSLVGGFLAVLGLYLGISQWKRGRDGRISPYRGWFYWHHIAGLVFGVFTLTWVLSGTLSMNPWGLLEGGGGNERVRLAGEPFSWADIRSSLEMLRENPLPADIVSLRSAPFDGKLFWLAVGQDGTTERLDARGLHAPVSAVDLGTAAKRLAGSNGIASQELMDREDAYYFEFPGFADRDSLVLPVYRVILSDAEQTRYYLDPNTGQLLRKADANGRGQRWLFSGFHRFDFAPWLRQRPVWDIIVLILMLGGTGVTATGAYLALLRIKRDLSFRREPAASAIRPPAE